MKHYITFEKNELSSTITTLGYNLQLIADNASYFQEYAKIHGVEHNFVIDSLFSNIDKSLNTLKSEFNLPQESNSCLELITQKKREEAYKRANKDHGSPYLVTLPKIKELARLFNEIAERNGAETDWDKIKLQCKAIL